MEYAKAMWEVEYTDEFGDWWETLGEEEQDAITFSIKLLWSEGPSLRFPHSSDVRQSRYKTMRELRSQCKGRPLRTFYVFDPSRTAILLLGGDKTGDDRFYEVMVPKADKIYDKYLQEKQEEKNANP